MATKSTAESASGQRQWLGMKWLFTLVGMTMLAAGIAFVFDPWSPAVIAPSQTLQTEQDLDFDTLAFYPKGDWLVAGQGATQIVVWELATGREIVSLEEDLSQGVVDLIRERQQKQQQAPASPAPPDRRPESPEEAGEAASDSGGWKEQSFAWMSTVNPGSFCVSDTPDGSAVHGYMAAHFFWDKNSEVDRAENTSTANAGVVSLSRFTLKASVIHQDGKSQSTGKTWTQEGSAFTATGFSPDGRWLLLSGENGQFFFVDNHGRQEWEVPAMQPFPFTNPEGRLSPLAILPDGRRVLMTDSAGVIEVRDLESGLQIRQLDGLQGPLDCFAIARDGRQLIADDQTHSLTLWNIETGRKIRSFEGQAGRVLGLAFSGDGRRFLSHGEDQTLRVWDAVQGHEIWQLAYPEQKPTAIAFAPDGTKIAVACGKKIQIWTLPQN